LRLKKSVKCDQIGVFSTGKSPKLYPEKLRKMCYYDAETDREFTFLTNNMELSSNEIALLYKNRWQIELFFYDKYIIIQSKEGLLVIKKLMRSFS
jgi:hypothetical protein